MNHKDLQETKNSIDEIFFRYLSQTHYDEKDLDYSLVEKHIHALKILADTTHSGIGLFDFYKKQMIFYSSNYGQLLGYTPEDYQETGQLFFASKFHPDDQLQLWTNGVTQYKLFHAFSSDEKLNHKVINEYRMLNCEGRYIRLIEQHQILELDKSGQLWLMLSMVDLSPNQEEYDGIKSQLLNFRTGNILSLDVNSKPQFELTKRELEILKLVRDGLLSKEISDKLSISVHTVNTHRQRFLEKTGAGNSMEAVLFASKYGLLD